ncbi:MSCRAMM family adhesin SdrC [Vannielia litorea]|uniref:COG4223 family protein n=1 Tax=Vannielia litorea TaxID=1217970 RepID=UPI001C980115|nr:MSCRAMM family adhesin SdrC [Vannielia litorea]MBY6154997.1 MSCRAMM family adhesin SdrC [Vannielia litorea]
MTVAGSDDKPDKTSDDAAKADTKLSIPEQSGLKNPSGKSDTSDATDSADQTAKPEPVSAADAPSGHAAAPDATLEPAEPLKAGATDRGPDTLEDDASDGSSDASADNVPDLTSEPEPEATLTAPAAPGSAPQKSTVVPMLFGGLLAGLIGFIAAWYIWGRDGSAAELKARVDAQAEALEGVQSAVESKASAEAVTALDGRIATLESAPAADTSETETTIANQAEALAAISARIEALEKAPVEGSSDEASQAALAAYGREVEALRKEVSEQMSQMNAALEAAKETEAQAAARQEEAAAAAARAAEQRAMLDVQQALETGVPYSEALGRISSAEIPEGLAAPASEGVPTLDSLKSAFPAAAREALKVSRAETAGEDGGGFGSWLTRQVGARSLEPKEGGDPDAVLSRAEAALNTGALATALEEIAALPPSGQDAMADWAAQARIRNDAVTGAESLSATLTSN